MQYNRLTNEELERRVYIEPTNQEAKAELLHRVTELMDQQNDEIEEAKQELEFAIEQHKGEMDAKDMLITELEAQIAEVINSRDLV